MIRACPVCRAPAGCVTGCPEALPEPGPTERAMGVVEEWIGHRFDSTPAKMGIKLDAVPGTRLQVWGVDEGIEDLVTVLRFDGFEAVYHGGFLQVWEEEP